jgi:Ca2+-binding RTX toxin-like protein
MSDFENDRYETRDLDAYRFSLSNGQVSGVYEWDDGRWQLDRIDANESWTLSASQIVHTETERGVAEVSVFQDLDADGVYYKVSESYQSIAPSVTLTQPLSSGTESGYRVTIANNSVAGVQEIHNGYAEFVRMDANETWSISGASIIKTEQEHGFAEVTVFQDPNGDGIYQKISQAYNNTNSIDATNTLPLPTIGGSDGQDIWLGTTTDDAYYGSEGDDDLYGGEGSDYLSGGNDNDHLSGGLGSDRLNGSSGDDYLNGGDGMDRATFSVQSADIESYGLSADGKTYMVKTTEGTDTLEGIEEVDFLNETYDISAVFSNAQAAPLFMTSENGVNGYLLPQRFIGDASLSLDYQLISQSFGAVLQGSSSNDFIKLAGLGNKACNGLDGNDVLDGGTGSAFLTGGGVDSKDTFFLDGRSAGDAWSTLTDFQVGTDALTIWGWTEGVSTVRAISEIEGAEGYRGLTLSFENLINDGVAGFSTEGQKLVTFSGLTADDFGAGSLEGLNTEIQNGLSAYSSLGVVTDSLGDHGYWQIS